MGPSQRQEEMGLSMWEADKVQMGAQEHGCAKPGEQDNG